MEFLPGILVLAIIMVLFLRLFRARKLEIDSTESNGRKLRTVEDPLVEKLRRRAEARRLKLKQDGFIANNFEDPHSDFLLICPSCLRQNEGATHYCVYCGMKLGSDLFNPITPRSHLGSNSMPHMRWSAERDNIENEVDETWLELGQDPTENQQVGHQGTASQLPFNKQNSQGITNPKSFPQKLFYPEIGPINKLDSKVGLKHAILLSEILGPPVSISKNKVWDLPD